MISRDVNFDEFAAWFRENDVADNFQKLDLVKPLSIHEGALKNQETSI